MMELEYDRSLIGQEHRSGPFHISRELIERFCAILGEVNPLYTDEKAAIAAGYRGLVAPPALCTLFANRVTLPDIGLKFGSSRVHAGQSLEPVAAVIAGDSLDASSYLRDVYAKTGRTGTMVFIVWETVFTNQLGEPVAAVQESFAARE